MQAIQIPSNLFILQPEIVKYADLVKLQRAQM